VDVASSLRRSLRDAKKFAKSEKAAEAQAAAAPAAAASGSSSAADGDGADADELLIGAGDDSPDGSSSSDSSIDSSDSDGDDADDADGGSDGDGGDTEGASKRRELAVLAKVRTTIKRGPLPSKAGDLRKAAKARGELLSEMRVSLVRSEDKNDRKDETIEELRASLKAVHEENAKLRTVATHAVEAAEEAHDKLEVYEDAAAILADAGLRNYPLEYSNALCSGRLCASPVDFGMRVRDASRSPLTVPALARSHRVPESILSRTLSDESRNCQQMTSYTQRYQQVVRDHYSYAGIQQSGRNCLKVQRGHPTDRALMGRRIPSDTTQRCVMCMFPRAA
jgi:hypothetical protein